MKEAESGIPTGLDRITGLLAWWGTPLEAGQIEAPLRRTIDACEVGRAALLLASDYTTAITGEVLYADAGFHIEGIMFH